MPHGFSFSTTTTVAFLKDKKNVKFVPIEVNRRSNDSVSTVKPSDAITTMMLIFRLIMLFSPLRIFFPVSLVLSFVGGMLLIQDISRLNINDSTIFVLLTSLLIFFFGLIADQISSLRRHLK